MAANDPGYGQFSGRFLVQTREGTIGLLKAWSTGLKFIPMNGVARKATPKQLSVYDAAQLFMFVINSLGIEFSGQIKTRIPEVHKLHLLAVDLIQPPLTADKAKSVARGGGDGKFWPRLMAFEHIYADSGFALAITYPNVKIIDRKKLQYAGLVQFSKHDGKWRATDVQRLHNEAIQAAIDEFLVKHPRAASSVPARPTRRNVSISTYAAADSKTRD